MPLSVPPTSSASFSAASLSASLSASTSTIGRCSVRVILLNRQELQISIENKNIRVGDLFSTTCEHVGLKETNYFGLAQKKDGEFQFLQLDTKLQKLGSKLWKSKNLLNNDKPQLTFYLRVMHYVNSIGLLRDRTTRHQYYLQLRENLLSYGQVVSEEKCFVLASYALQADFGPYQAEQHVGAYFDPREYFPAWVVMRRGQDYITTNLPVMHRDMAAMTQGDARVAFIRELSCPPICHNFHFYHLRRRKYDSAATIWLAICPRGLEVHEEVKEFKNLLSVFYWQNIEKLHHDKKKFEIVTDSSAERKFTYYVTGKEWGEHLLMLCRSSHHFQMSLQPRLLEMEHHEAQDQRFREMYVHGENGGRRSSSQERMWQMAENRLSSSASSSLTNQSLTSSGGCGPALSTVPENAVTKTPNAKGSDAEEIMIVSPPLMSSTLTTISPMSDLPQSSLWSSPGDLQSPSGRGSGRTFRRLSSSGHQGASRGVGSFIAKHNLASSSSSKPNSSVESLIAYTLSNSNSPSVGRTQASLSSSPASSPMKQHQQQQQGARDDASRPWLASSSVNSTPSWRSASPNSSTGSGQLLFSLPPKQTLVDAASLRKSLPHGTTLNEYISRIFSGEEMTPFAATGGASGGGGFHRLQRRKSSSLDEDQQACLSFSTTGDLISRSTSLRQPSEMRPKTDKKGGMVLQPPPGAGYDSQAAGEVGWKEYHRPASSLFPVQSLPQMPVPAQVQRIVFPERMTAISTSVRPTQGRSFGESPLHATAAGVHPMSSYSPEDSPGGGGGGGLVQPLHSTPIPSRYQLNQQQQVHVANIPMSYATPANSRVYETPANLLYETPANSNSSGGFDQSLAVPSFAFPASTVISTAAADVDYRGKLPTSMLDYTRPIATGQLSVFGQNLVSTGGAQSLFFTSAPAPIAQEPLPRSDPPPAYHEWQAAAQAMAVLQGQRQLLTQADETDAYGFDFMQSRIVDERSAAANDNSLSLTSYLNGPQSHGLLPEYNINANRTPFDVTYDLGRVTDDTPQTDVFRTSDGHLQERHMKPVSTSENQNLQLPIIARKLCTEFSANRLDPNDARMNIREKLRNVGPTDLPMLKALLTDKSLLNYPSPTTDQTPPDESHRIRALAVQPRPLSWHHEHQHLRRNGELVLRSVDEFEGAADVNVKPVSNGDVSRMNGHAGETVLDGKVRIGGPQAYYNGLRLHASDVATTSSSNGVANHNQSQSDSVTLKSRGPVANEC